MTDALWALLATLLFALLALIILRFFQVWTARNKERVLSDDNPNNDSAYDDLEDDLAKDTEPWKK